MVLTEIGHASGLVEVTGSDNVLNSAVLTPALAVEKCGEHGETADTVLDRDVAPSSLLARWQIVQALSGQDLYVGGPDWKVFAIFSSVQSVASRKASLVGITMHVSVDELIVH